MAAPRDYTCPGCGLTYDRFRTGMTYREVYMLMWSYNDDPATWRNKGRHVVLGLWRQIKLSLWERHIDAECVDAVPF